MNINKVIIVGRMTRDAELKTLPNGTAVTKFGLATNHTFKNKDGEKKETVQFHNCVVFGRPAEVINQYVHKGDELGVEGRIEYREWEKKDGGKGTATEIMVETFHFGAKSKGSEAKKSAEETPEEVDEIKSEDIPF